MAETNGKWGNMRAGKRDRFDFSKLVSPLGENGAEDPAYSPSHEVTSAKAQGHGHASHTIHDKQERRHGR